jgi:hypothetical protein
LSLAGGAAAAIGQPPSEMAARNTPVTQEITLAEVEISGVSLATFHVFDKENATKTQRGTRFAMGRRRDPLKSHGTIGRIRR